MHKTPQELYAEREKRYADAIALRTPDRVPIAVSFAFFPARYCGFTHADMMYDLDKVWEAQLKTTIDFAPDMAQNPFGSRGIGPLLDILDFQQLKWPGRQLPADVSFQFVEGEYMKADEYDHFLSDTSDFMVRKYWPRLCGELKAFEQLPPIHTIISYYLGLVGFGAFGMPEVQSALKTLMKAGEEIIKSRSYAQRFNEKLKEEGFPSLAGGGTQAPFDTLGDFFRGTKGLMLDMYRRPQLVEKACEKLLPYMLEMALAGAKRSGNTKILIPLHKGLDGFMSLEQFKRFYWPTFRELMIGIINEGLNPCPFWEGDCTSRLEFIKDIPPAKACYSFEATDMTKAKDILGDGICIKGGLPISVLATGTPEDVKAHCKKLIDHCGRGGGFIMDASTGLDDAKPENVKMMFEFTKEYSTYR
ncbi:MAG TPA: uroporphyrinogen decarboxylase family protein [Syntrophorhabdaceae bacterium]|nr:uroporphyrinogen decarboxylase family protein [Syntrophorhabdaceae bacterium]